MKNSAFNHLNDNYIPFYGRIEEFQILNDIVGETKVRISKTESPREIVLESWFLFDFLIRKLLLKAFNIDKYENEDFDPMYEYLPQSFDSCLNNFEKLLKQQRHIYEAKLHPNTVRNYPLTYTPGSFFLFLQRKEPEFLMKLLDLTEEYEESYESEYIKLKDKFDSMNNKCEAVSSIWIECCENIDDNWFKEIRRLNKIRNKAAHNFNSEIIYQNFGINGENKMEKLRSEITKLLDNLFYFK